MVDTFILGIRESVDGSCYMDTKAVYDATGGNVGNLVFHYAINKILGGTQETRDWAEPMSALNATGKTAVIPCANQLGPHADFGGMATRFASLDIGLMAIGLGAQGDSEYGAVPAVPEGTQRWVAEIAKRSVDGAPNIGVRGPFTMKVLEHYRLGDRAIVTGCPSLFINPDPNLGQKIEERAKRPFKRLAVTAGHQGWKHLARLENSMARMMEASGGAYFVQSPQEMVALARGESSFMSKEDLTACRDFVCPHLDLEEFAVWSRKYFRVVFNVSEWMEALRGFDFVFGLRIHGVMLGLQAGVPSLCVAHDSRTRELCEVMKVPFVMARDVLGGMTPELIRSRFEFDGAAFDENRRLLAGRMEQFLAGNRVAESAWLKRVCGG